MSIRYVSVFSGIEAASVAWEPLGWDPVAFCEIDEFPSAVLAEHFPHVPNLGDMTKVDWSDYAGKADVLVGGSPCQSFSVAGRREGLAGASGLMWEYVRAARELRPKWLVWENVPGALSSARGEDFRCLLTSLDDLGYGMAWRVLDAEFFGVAQRRRRVFLVGCLGDPERAVKILFERESLRWDTPTSRDKRKELAGATWSGAGSDSEDGCLTPWDVQYICMASGQANAEIENDLCPAMAARQYKDPPIVIYADDETPMVLYKGVYWVVRRLMPVECEQLQGFPDGWTDIPWHGKESAPDGPRYKALGNSMAVPVMRWIGERMEAVI